jgi:hypothetical protein
LFLPVVQGPGAVGFSSQGEAEAVELVVVVGAEQGEVVEVGVAFVGEPFFEVVDFAPAGRSVALGVDAALVSEDESFALMSWSNSQDLWMKIISTRLPR